jgi:hypothetical protein
MLKSARSLFQLTAKRIPQYKTPLLAYSFSNLKKYNDDKHLDIPTSEHLIQNDLALSSYVLKVYRTTGISVGTFLGGSYLLSTTAAAMSFASPLMWGGLATSLLSIIGFYFTPQTITEKQGLDGQIVKTIEDSYLRKMFYAGIIGGSTLSMAPFVGYMNFISPNIIPIAAVASMAVMGGSSLYAIKQKQGSFTAWRSALFGGLLGLVGLQIVSGLTFMAIGPNMFTMMATRFDTIAGLGLFTAFQMFDTQEVITEYSEGKRDHLNHSINFFLNFINFFRRAAEVVASFFTD